MLPTHNAELGVQWRGQSGSLSGELTDCFGLEARAWINGGGWHMHQNEGGMQFPWQLGSFGLAGFSLSAQDNLSMWPV
ncbi:MAG: hypothetical protein COC23_07605 [Hyphomicrobiales bacterium]|nr:MAG: hypothetical protein COC23_07605 [Hyphomicrobiales bacterium]